MGDKPWSKNKTHPSADSPDRRTSRNYRQRSQRSSPNVPTSNSLRGSLTPSQAGRNTQEAQGSAITKKPSYKKTCTPRADVLSLTGHTIVTEPRSTDGQVGSADESNDSPAIESNNRTPQNRPRSTVTKPYTETMNNDRGTVSARRNQTVNSLNVVPPQMSNVAPPQISSNPSNDQTSASLIYDRSERPFTNQTPNTLMFSNPTPLNANAKAFTPKNPTANTLGNAFGLPNNSMNESPFLNWTPSNAPVDFSTGFQKFGPPPAVPCFNEYQSNAQSAPNLTLFDLSPNVKYTNRLSPRNHQEGAYVNTANNPPPNYRENGYQIDFTRTHPPQDTSYNMLPPAYNSTIGPTPIPIYDTQFWRRPLHEDPRMDLHANFQSDWSFVPMNRVWVIPSLYPPQRPNYYLISPWVDPSCVIANITGRVPVVGPGYNPIYHVLSPQSQLAPLLFFPNGAPSTIQNMNPANVFNTPQADLFSNAASNYDFPQDMRAPYFNSNSYLIPANQPPPESGFIPRNNSVPLYLRGRPRTSTDAEYSTSIDAQQPSAMNPEAEPPSQPPFRRRYSSVVRSSKKNSDTEAEKEPSTSTATNNASVPSTSHERKPYPGAPFTIDHWDPRVGAAIMAAERVRVARLGSVEQERAAEDIAVATAVVPTSQTVPEMNLRPAMTQPRRGEWYLPPNPNVIVPEMNLHPAMTQPRWGEWCLPPNPNEIVPEMNLRPAMTQPRCGEWFLPPNPNAIVPEMNLRPAMTQPRWGEWCLPPNPNEIVPEMNLRPAMTQPRWGEWCLPPNPNEIVPEMNLHPAMTQPRWGEWCLPPNPNEIVPEMNLRPAMTQPRCGEWFLPPNPNAIVPEMNVRPAMTQPRWGEWCLPPNPNEIVPEMNLCPAMTQPRWGEWCLPPNPNEIVPEMNLRPAMNQPRIGEWFPSPDPNELGLNENDHHDHMRYLFEGPTMFDQKSLAWK